MPESITSSFGQCVLGVLRKTSVRIFPLLATHNRWNCTIIHCSLLAQVSDARGMAGCSAFGMVAQIQKGQEPGGQCYISVSIG